MLHTDQDQIDEDKVKVTFLVTSLPPDRSVSLEQVEKYFLKQGDHIRVHSTTWVGGGNAQLKLYGLTLQGVQYAMCTCIFLSLSSAH